MKNKVKPVYIPETKEFIVGSKVIREKEISKDKVKELKKKSTTETFLVDIKESVDVIL